MQKTKYLTENWALMENEGKVYMAEVIMHNEQGKVRFEFKQISKRYDEICDFDDNGIAIVRNDEFYGLIHDSGKEIVKPQQFKIRGIFSKFYHSYIIGKKTLIIDRNGEVKEL